MNQKRREQDLFRKQTTNVSEYPPILSSKIPLTLQEMVVSPLPVCSAKLDERFLTNMIKKIDLLCIPSNLPGRICRFCLYQLFSVIVCCLITITLVFVWAAHVFHIAVGFTLNYHPHFFCF